MEICIITHPTTSLFDRFASRFVSRRDEHSAQKKNLDSHWILISSYKFHQSLETIERMQRNRIQFGIHFEIQFGNLSEMHNYQLCSRHFGSIPSLAYDCLIVNLNYCLFPNLRQTAARSILQTKSITPNDHRCPRIEW